MCVCVCVCVCVCLPALKRVCERARASSSLTVHVYDPFAWYKMHTFLFVGRVVCQYARLMTHVFFPCLTARTNVEMVVRSCDMENFDNTCGPFIFEGDTYHGCLMSCKTNACNSAASLVPSSSDGPWWWRKRWRWWDRNIRSLGYVWTVVVVTVLLTTPHILWDLLWAVVGSRTAALL